MDDAAVAATVRDEGDKGCVSDGLETDDAGRLYVTDGEHDAVHRWLPDGTWETVVSDPRLLWPDTLSVADGWLYVSEPAVPADQVSRGSRRAAPAVRAVPHADRRRSCPAPVALTVVVVGQVARDLVLRVPGLPDAGGSTPVEERLEVLGGKGANQAVGLAQLGRAQVVRADAAEAAQLTGGQVGGRPDSTRPSWVGPAQGMTSPGLASGSHGVDGDALAGDLLRDGEREADDACLRAALQCAMPGAPLT